MKYHQQDQGSATTLGCSQSPKPTQARSNKSGSEASQIAITAFTAFGETFRENSDTSKQGRVIRCKRASVASIIRREGMVPALAAFALRSRPVVGRLIESSSSGMSIIDARPRRSDTRAFFNRTNSLLSAGAPCERATGRTIEKLIETG